MFEITIWETYTNGEWRHNHIENDFAVGDKPVPRFDSQNGWRNMAWRKSFGYLVGGKVVRA